KDAGLQGQNQASALRVCPDRPSPLYLGERGWGEGACCQRQPPTPPPPPPSTGGRGANFPTNSPGGGGDQPPPHTEEASEFSRRRQASHVRYSASVHPPATARQRLGFQDRQARVTR